VAWRFAGDLQGFVLDVPLMRPGLAARLGVTAALVAGVMLHVVAAGVISRAGLCNGWLAIIGLQLVRDLPHDAPTLGVMLLAAVAAAALVTHARGARLPGAGIAALLAANAVLLALLQLLRDELDAPQLLAWLLARSPLEQLLGLAALAALVAETRPAPMISGAAFTAFLLLLPGAAPHAVQGALLGAIAVELAIGVAAAIRIPGRTELITLHDVDRADAVAAAVAAAGVPVAVTGAAGRALLRGFGALVPVTVQVPARRLDDAQRAAAPVLEPAVAVFD
jgi:hypothetical protein